jgi:hypothetical protein
VTRGSASAPAPICDITAVTRGGRGHACGHRIRHKLLMPRNRHRQPHEQVTVGDEYLADEVRVERFDGATDGRTRLVDPGTEFHIRPEVVTEFVGDDCSQFVGGQRLAAAPQPATRIAIKIDERMARWAKAIAVLGVST